MVTATLYFIPLTLLIAYVSAAGPGFTTVGLRFVVAFPIPYHRGFYLPGLIIFTSERSSANVTVRWYKKGQYRWAEAYYQVTKNSDATHKATYKLERSGIHKAIVVESRSPIRVYVLQRDLDNDLQYAYRVMPEQSCYRSYYVTTSLGYPSIMVMSFTAKTSVRVQFPQYDHPFDDRCHADANCVSGKATAFKLEPYSVWYHYRQRENIQFHNTRIQSDAPIFVVSGSTDCLFPDVEGNGGWKGNNGCLTDTKPTWTWGKTYVVPMLRVTIKGKERPTREYLRTNAKKFPLEIIIHDGLSYDKIAKKDVIKDHQDMYSFDIDSPHIIHAKVPFGLYLFSPVAEVGGNLAGLLNLIPVEQWMNGHEPKNVVFHALKQDYPFENYYFSTNNKDKSYSFTRESKTFAAQRRVMHYMIGSQEGSTNFLLPYDYHQGAIYYPQCRKFTAVVDDGIDNDCDGHIDEEIVNEKDDDGDGSIDEDTAETVRNGGWSSWTEVCTCESNKGKWRTSVRECNNPPPSRLGMECNGTSSKCEPNGVCQVSGCTKVCKCLDGCLRCDSHQEEVCKICKNGYVAGGYCLTPCPKYWNGMGCINGPQDVLHTRMRWDTDMDFLKDKGSDHTD